MIEIKKIYKRDIVLSRPTFWFSPATPVLSVALTLQRVWIIFLAVLFIFTTVHTVITITSVAKKVTGVQGAQFRL